MSKITLDSVASGFDLSKINNNFQAIQTALENTLSRDGTTPNSMSADIDMNGNRLINLLATSGEGFVWRGSWVTLTSYSLNHLVYESGNTYICTSTHTSGDFGTDFGNGLWELFAAKGSAGAGTGDMIGANNLSDLTDFAVARATLGVQPTASPTFTGTVSAPTPAGASDTTVVATTEWVRDTIAALASTTPTGTTVDYVGTTAPSGWVLLSGRTIGSASSGATERANADTETLYTLLWNSMANTEAPVSTGRGASAAADFAANKTITLPDARGRVVAGKDDMGGSTASRLTVTGGIVGTTLGVVGGTETHTLITSELPAHSHGLVDNQGVSGVESWGYSSSLASTGGTTRSTNNAGSGTAHKNTQPTLVLNKIVKL